MANPTFFSEGHTPRSYDTRWKIDQKILGAIIDELAGGGGGGGGADASGTEALGAGVESGTVTFAAPLASAPVVHPSIQIPSGGDVITAVVVGDPTVNGFDYQLDGITPDANYKLHWEAFV